MLVKKNEMANTTSTSVLFGVIVAISLLSFESRAEEENHVVATLVFRGASAEELRSVVLPLSRHFALGEIRDGDAILYFRSTVRRVTTLLEEASKDFPVGLSVKRIVPGAGKIPEPTVQIPVRRKICHIEGEMAAKHGISALAIAEKLSELRGSGSFNRFSDGDVDVTVKTIDGRDISLRPMVRIEEIEVKRPLIVSSRGKD